MKMICDVPDEVIKCIKDGMWCGSHIAEKMITNGIPLNSMEEPCEDAISRQAAKKALEDRFIELQKRHDDKRYETNYCLNTILELPSVNPQEPKTGHWITQWNVAHQKEYYYCSECREEFSYDGETGIKMNDYRYCPNCGAKMIEPQEGGD